MLDSEINRAISTPDHSSLSRSDQRNSDCVPLVVTYMYHPNLPRLELPPHLTELRSTKTGHSIFSHHWMGKRNLRDLLVHTDQETYTIYWYAPIFVPKLEIPSNFRCEARRCKTCPILVTTDTFASSVTGERFKLKLCASCKTTNVIYLIQCRRCGFQCVRETGQPLYSRMNSHRFNITHGRIDESPVAAHFTSKGHTEADLLVMIIDKCWKKDAILRKIRESRWIRTLKTSWPSGMNQRTDGL